MSQDEGNDATKKPEVGGKFYIPSEDDGSPDEEMEIDEILAEDDGSFNVASSGDFYDIGWSEGNQRWEEQR